MVPKDGLLAVAATGTILKHADNYIAKDVGTGFATTVSWVGLCLLGLETCSCVMKRRMRSTCIGNRRREMLHAERHGLIGDIGDY